MGSQSRLRDFVKKNILNSRRSEYFVRGGGRGGIILLLGSKKYNLCIKPL